MGKNRSHQRGRRQAGGVGEGLKKAEMLKQEWGAVTMSIAQGTQP